ncbi:hypothetical protein ZWY2020_049849 [Hordeum vulgare]|nr:hypothetical protein ZWY2020_049849 [Hordeum vulgare]
MLFPDVAVVHFGLSRPDPEFHPVCRSRVNFGAWYWHFSRSTAHNLQWLLDKFFDVILQCCSQLSSRALGYPAVSYTSPTTPSCRPVGSCPATPRRRSGRTRASRTPNLRIYRRARELLSRFPLIVSLLYALNIETQLLIYYRKEYDSSTHYNLDSQ